MKLNLQNIVIDTSTKIIPSNIAPVSLLSILYQQWNPGGYLVQKTLQGCATNMGSKISLLVYEWPLIKCTIWYMNGLIFQNLAKFGSNLRKFCTKLVICSKFGQKLGQLVYEWVTFSWKTGICVGLLSNSVAAHPYQNQTWVPPGNEISN